MKKGSRCSWDSDPVSSAVSTLSAVLGDCVPFAARPGISVLTSVRLFRDADVGDMTFIILMVTAIILMLIINTR